MNASDALEFALHPDREEARAALKEFVATPGQDVVMLISEDGEHRIADFASGDLATIISKDFSEAHTVIVERKGKEVFRWENIRDLFGVIWF